MNKIPLVLERADARLPVGRRGRSLTGRLLAAIVVLALLVLLALDGTRMVGRFMPFAVERNVAANYVADLPAPTPYSKALNAFAEDIAALQGVPPGIAVEVHVIAREPVQAFPTLGGHILLFEGLLRALRSEDELTALLSHQIAHLRLRHPAEALGRRVSVGLMLSLFSQELAENFARPSFHASLSTAPSFLEEHEIATLMDTGSTLVGRYGHLGGAADLSKTLRRIIGTTPDAEVRIAETHPGIARLDEALERLASENGWQRDHPKLQRRPLPPALQLNTATAASAARAPAEPASAPHAPAAEAR